LARVWFGDSDVNRLLKTFRGEPTDRVPHLEYWYGWHVPAHVLGRPPQTMRDWVEFARAIGMDAIPVHYGWRPGNVFERSADGRAHYIDGRIKRRDDLRTLEPPPPLEDFERRLEEALEAAEGTGVGVFASISSFFDGTYLAMGYDHFALMLYDDLPFVEELMDILCEQFVKAVEIACRYPIAFLFVNDDIAVKGGLLCRPDLFRELFIPRMERMVAPAKRKGIPLTFHTDGALDEVIPILLELGFCAIHPVDPAANDIYELKRKWGDKITLHGNIPCDLLLYGSLDEVEAAILERLERLSVGGRYILGSGSSIFEPMPVENVLAMPRLVHEWRP